MSIMRYTRTKNVIPLSSNGPIVFCMAHLRHGKHVKRRKTWKSWIILLLLWHSTLKRRQNIEYDKLSDILHDVIEGGGMKKYINFEVAKTQVQVMSDDEE
jgi:hypothetical protein